MTGRPALFLDRDGVLTVEDSYITRPENLRLETGAAEAVRILNAAGVLAVVVSNQSGVARGLMSEQDMADVHARLEQLLAEGGARLDAAYYCPNHLDGTVERFSRDASCRKPQTGMIDAAVRDLDIDLSTSAMVGDQLTDAEFAERAGIPCVLVETGKGESSYKDARASGLPVAALVPGVLDAARWMVARLELR